MRLFVLAGALLCAAGCTYDCTSMGCGPAHTILVDEPLDEVGSYEFVAVTGGWREPMLVEVPAAPGTLPRDCGDLHLGFSEAGALRSIVSQESIRRLAVTISLNGVVVVEEAFSPRYSSIELNGPGCGSCRSASDRL